MGWMAQVATPSSPTRKLLAGESAAPPAAKPQKAALPSDPADVWLQSYGPCMLLLHFPALHVSALHSCIIVNTEQSKLRQRNLAHSVTQIHQLPA